MQCKNNPKENDDTPRPKREIYKRRRVRRSEEADDALRYPPCIDLNGPTARSLHARRAAAIWRVGETRSTPGFSSCEMRPYCHVTSRPHLSAASPKPARNMLRCEAQTRTISLVTSHMFARKILKVSGTHRARCIGDQPWRKPEDGPIAPAPDTKSYSDVLGCVGRG